MTQRFDPDQVPGALDEQTARLERLVNGALLMVPGDIWLDRGLLRWRMGRSDKSRGGMPNHPRYVEPGPGLLTCFLNLAEAEDEQILAFAERWGVLGLCDHGMPHTHRPFAPYNVTDVQYREGEPENGPNGAVNLPIVVTVLSDWCRPRGWVECGGAGGHEPPSLWRNYSRLAAVIVKTIAALHEDGAQAKRPRAEVEYLRSGALVEYEKAAEVPVGWIDLDGAISRWLGMGDVRQFLRLRDATVTVQLGTHCIDGSTCGLFGALAVQLLMSAAGGGGLAFCEACKEFSNPESKPRSGVRWFCHECREKGAPRKFAARDYRRRVRQRAVSEASTLQAKRD